MAEYIEREPKCGECHYADFCEQIPSISAFNRDNIAYCKAFKPAADVVEVRHGEWNVTENRQHLDVECSICKSSFYVYKQGQYRIDRSNYCPNCGAKMDGKGDK